VCVCVCVCVCAVYEGVGNEYPTPKRTGSPEAAGADFHFLSLSTDSCFMFQEEVANQNTVCCSATKPRVKPESLCTATQWLCRHKISLRINE
jgi:hypothetical protein